MMAPATGNTSPPSSTHRRLAAFLIHSANQFNVDHIVKYSALSLFLHRFHPSISTTTAATNHWLLRRPITESNLQIFALISLWISSKSHSSRPLTRRSLKSLSDALISDQVFTASDFLEAEIIFLKFLRFEIGSLNNPFFVLEELIEKLTRVAVAGKFLPVEACLDILDLLYETDEFYETFQCPVLLAGAIVVAVYAITVPKQASEFPVLAWVKFITLYSEHEITELVRRIFCHVFKD